jgi:hypothetical protein
VILTPTEPLEAGPSSPAFTLAAMPVMATKHRARIGRLQWFTVSPLKN